MAKLNGSTASTFQGKEGIRFALQAARNHLANRTVSGAPIEQWQQRAANSVEVERLLKEALADPLLQTDVPTADALIALPPVEVVVPASEAPPVEDEAAPTLPVSEFEPTREERVDAALHAEPDSEAAAA